MSPRVPIFVAALMLLVLGAAAPASADSYRHRDAKHDVNNSAAPPCLGCLPIADAPTRRAEDIVGFGVRFDASGLRLTLGGRSAPRHASVPDVTWLVHTSKNDNLAVVVHATRHGTVHVRVPHAEAKCSDTTATFTNRPREWTTTLSLACLGGAAWVQVGAITQHDSFSDDALIDGATCCSPAGMSPKVRRG